MATGRDERKRKDVKTTGIEELREDQAEMLGGSSTWRMRVPGWRRAQRTRCQRPW